MADLDNERRERIARIVQQLQEATAGRPLDDIQVAVGNVIAQLCRGSVPDDPDLAFLTFHQAITEIWVQFRAHARSGAPLDTLVN